MGKMRNTVLARIIAGCLIFSAPSLFAVTGKSGVGRQLESEKISSLTTGPATRAQSDIAVRQLKKLFAAQKLDPQVFFEKLKLLQE